MPEPVLAGLLLAAGGSGRLGEAKQLVKVNGESLVRRTARLLLAHTGTVVVVTGAEAESVGMELRDLPVGLRHNGAWPAGMGGSIASGMGALGDRPAGVLIMLCDQWRVGSRHLAELCGTWKLEPSCVVAARWGRHFGAPAIFPRRLFATLRGLAGEGGAKGVIAGQQDVRFVDMPDAGQDLDTPEDLAVLRTCHRGPE